jgi:hypothetical protein
MSAGHPEFYHAKGRGAGRASDRDHLTRIEYRRVPKVEFLIIAVSDFRNDGAKNYRDVAKGTQRADDIWSIFCVHLTGPRGV